MKKKMKRMVDGGTVATTSVQSTGLPPPANRPANRIGDKMKELFEQAKTRFSNSNWKDKMPGDFRDGMRGRRDERRADRFTGRYDRLSKMYPDYKPTLSGPVDTRDEFKEYRKGLREYLKANPNVKPALPARQGNGGNRLARPPFPPRPTTRPTGGGMTKPSTPGKATSTQSTARPPQRSSRKGDAISKLFYSTGPAWSQDYKAGGLVKANGCASRGKTKGKIV